MTDITDLFRACLVALQVPEQADAYELKFIKLWQVPDAMARMTRMLEAPPQGGSLASFPPKVDVVGSEKELRCQAAVASAFLPGLGLRQEREWADVLIASVCAEPGSGAFKLASCQSDGHSLRERPSGRCLREPEWP